MPWECGQIVDGVLEFCDACWECSSRCSACEEWFNKEQVGQVGFCTECEQERMHAMSCFDCGHDWKTFGFSARCPKCGSFTIFVGDVEDLFSQHLLEERQIAYIKQLTERPSQFAEEVKKIEKSKHKNSTSQKATDEKPTQTSA